MNRISEANKLTVTPAGYIVYLILFLRICAQPVYLYSQSWSVLGAGTNNTVYALAADTINDVLYVGGKFTTAGGSAANYIAQWDGSNWVSVGNNFNARIYYLGILGGELYATGDFTIIDGVTVNHIAKWNGTNWLSFGDGVDGTVYCAEIYNDTLYIGGSFLNSGSTPVSKIARFNGSAWEETGGGMNFKVRTLKVFNGELYAGGAFTTTGSGPANRIAKWDDSSWSALGNGMDFDVYDLEVYNNEIHASGWFSPSPAKYIARWDGAAWQSLGSGTNARVPAMTVFNNELYITGAFTTVGTVGANRIAKWNGSSWSVVGAPGLEGGPTAEGYALALYKGGLYVGGEFTTAGGLSAGNIARWGDSCLFPVAGFNYTVGSGAQVFLTNSSSAGTYNWDFGDSITDTTANPSHTYSVSGTYYLCLTVTDSCGTDTFCDSVMVYYCPLPTAGFTSADSGLTVNFTNTSSGGTYNWDFGDSTFDTTADPSHTYAASGAYYVCLMVTDSCGADTICDSVTVYYCPLPTTGFTFADSGLTVNFTNTSSGGTYNWDFGDSTFDTTADPSHTYAASGAYYVCLMVTDSCGTAMFCDSLSVIGTGIKEQDILKQIIIYPNPVSNILYIQLNDFSKYVLINVFDVVGRRILKKEIINEKEITIDLSGYEEGTYLIEFRMGDTRTVREVIHINSQKD